MGYLEFTTDKILTYSKSKQHQQKIKKHAADQFLKLFTLHSKFKSKENSHLYHGYEVEGFILKKDSKTQNYFFNTDINYFLNAPHNKDRYDLKPEGSSPQFEIATMNPYQTFLSGKTLLEDLKEANSHFRKNLKEGEEMIMMTHFPSTGCPNTFKYFEGYDGLSFEKIKEKNSITLSRTFPDSLITLHPRCLAGGRSLSERNGSPAKTYLELYKDENTDMESTDEINDKPGFVTLEGYFPCTTVSSLQITFASSDIKQARWQYDQLHILSSIFVTFSF